MALAPHSFGTRKHAVRVESAGEERWRVTVDEQPLSPTFESQREARRAAAAEVARLDALALALLRRVRSRLTRKCP
ncbi:MAG TPA: hypothetical protein VFK90_00170 [Anaeromyxobacter sp.]|nr:hypothetical protein [Anaeromyxobacter sp.]